MPWHKDRVHQQTQRVQALVNGQDKEAECFWKVRLFLTLFL